MKTVYIEQICIPKNEEPVDSSAGFQTSVILCCNNFWFSAIYYISVRNFSIFGITQEKIIEGLTNNTFVLINLNLIKILNDSSLDNFDQNFRINVYLCFQMESVNHPNAILYTILWYYILFFISLLSDKYISCVQPKIDKCRTVYVLYHCINRQTNRNIIANDTEFGALYKNR